MIKSCLLIYRGPLERSRLTFIFESLGLLFEKVEFIWLLPHSKFYNKDNKRFDDFIKKFPSIEFSIINSESSKVLGVRKKLKRKLEHSNVPLFMIGLSTPFFVPQGFSSKIIWFINGIPEEKLLHNNSITVKVRAWMSWKLVKIYSKPDLIVTVSTRMGKYVNEKFPEIPFYAVPTCVDHSIFKSKENKGRKYFTYLGSGAPWQNLDVLSKIWQEIHKLEPNIQFRVISRDSRTKILAEGIGKNRIEFVGSEDFEEIAEFLSESLVGFLIREDNLVNRVSYPTKMAEYLASGSWVVSSDIDWDVGDLIRKYEVGLLVKPKSDPSVIATEILSKIGVGYDTDDFAKKIDQALEVLHKEYWVDRFQGILKKKYLQ